MLFINGTKDKLFPANGAQDAFNTMREVWESDKASDKLITKFYELPHFCSKDIQKDVLEFFNKNIKEMIDEKI